MIAGITEKEQKIIERILDKYRKDYAFFYYGSRVKGTYEKTSDLDVLIKGKAEMPLAILQEIKEEFDKSDLPYIVNFSDYYKLDSSFYERIKLDLIPYNWQEVKLGNFLIINPTEKLSKGTIAKKVSMEKLQPFSRDVSGYELDEFSGGAKFRNKDTIMARITPCLENGKRAQINILKQGDVGFGSTEFIVFREKGNISDANFIYYLVCSDLIRSPAIKSMVGSSGRQRVQTNVLENLHLSLPPLTIQKKIAGVLGALDDKIELNNKINQNLEAQAQALFKSWFVDFEPFGGQMPSDWKIGKLGDICECLLGGTPNRNIPEFWNGNIPWINSGEVNAFRITKPSEYISELGLSKSATKLLPAKTTVIAITGATLGKVSLLEINSCANQSVVGVLPNSNIPYEFIYPFVKHNILELISHQTGGAQQHINKQNVEQIKLYIPPYGILHQYQTSVKPIYKMIANNCFENTRLAEVRDILLPKLMFGEINVDNVKID